MNKLCGYNKIIISGNDLEVYEYEKDIVTLVGGTSRRRSDNDVYVGLGDDGKDSLQKGNDSASTGKRQDNARRASMAFRRIITSNLVGAAPATLVTLTYADNYTDLKGAYRHLTAFNQSLRYRYSEKLSHTSSSPNFKNVEQYISTLSTGGYPRNYFIRKGKLEHFRNSGGAVLYF